MAKRKRTTRGRTVVEIRSGGGGTVDKPMAWISRTKDGSINYEVKAFGRTAHHAREAAWAEFKLLAVDVRRMMEGEERARLDLKKKLAESVANGVKTP